MPVPAFALLHGGGQGSWVWDDLADVLRAEGATVLALDVPGCGTKREREHAALDLDTVAAELVRDIRAAGLSGVVLVGHSLAGALMPRMAELAPELFDRLVYVSCSAPPAGTSFATLIGSGLHGESEEAVGWPVDPATHSEAERYRIMFCNDMRQAEADAFLARLGSDHWPMDVLLRTDWRYDHLAAIPASYVLCEQDQSLPAMWQERFAGRFHAGRIVRLDAGHQAMNTQPESLARILLAEGIA
jgi:pimeloyl-ACP methyl ester carboxylesterase